MDDAMDDAIDDATNDELWDDTRDDRTDDTSTDATESGFGRWASLSRSHYSVVVLNDRLMSETLLSDDDPDDDSESAFTVRRPPKTVRTDSASDESAAEEETGSAGHTRGQWPAEKRSEDLKNATKVEKNRFSEHSLASIDLKVNELLTQCNPRPPIPPQHRPNPPSTLAALLNNPCLPPTPPSSVCGSDSEATALRQKAAKKAVLGGICRSQLISSLPKNAIHGSAVVLTEEEKRTLLAEGYPIPQRFPLTKSEERSLKKIRRKIKNKISAQESRRKKKEYMEELERKVQTLDSRVRELEKENKTLKNQTKV
ncbi:cyclic AMP-responsive element-binding protein 3-like protein 2 [Oppia nitens]|uniref:cyclic AMP-responsive element-binding protein 3-like protein 2 n=1 Tax=Oppia nitens TaxID=1686743 RepID=UPI0023DB38FF|nr:cyclic AMP-responsive element-binding protein 3-like protein 2 [Oppia nitens]